MQYGVGQAEAVHAVAGDDSKAKTLVKAQRLWVLLVHIHVASPKRKGFAHEGRADTLVPGVRMDEEHFDAIPSHAEEGEGAVFV